MAVEGAGVLPNTSIAPKSVVGGSSRPLLCEVVVWKGDIVREAGKYPWLVALQARDFFAVDSGRWTWHPSFRRAEANWVAGRHARIKEAMIDCYIYVLP